VLRTETAVYSCCRDQKNTFGEDVIDLVIFKREKEPVFTTQDNTIKVNKVLEIVLSYVIPPPESTETLTNRQEYLYYDLTSSNILVAFADKLRDRKFTIGTGGG
jgi:hypothetical protein